MPLHNDQPLGMLAKFPAYGRIVPTGSTSPILTSVSSRKPISLLSVSFHFKLILCSG